MLYTLSQAIEAIGTAKKLAIEPFKGRDGLWGVAVFTDDKFIFVPGDDLDLSKIDFKKTQVACWDIRRCLSWIKSDSEVVWDVKLLNGGDKTLVQLARERTNDVFRNYVELDSKMVAHSRAAKTVKMESQATLIAPVELVKEWMRVRTEIIYKLFLEIDNVGISTVDEYERRWSFIRSLREVELNGIRVDKKFAEVILEGQTDQANYRALSSIKSLEKNGYVTTLLNPMGSKTGRIRSEGGFNSLAIPKGSARSAIISRFDGGKIVTFDFNAIDYRCIVKAVGGEVAALYDGARDFHERTASFVFKNVTPASREAIKYLSYIYIYGGSEDTLAAKTGWKQEDVHLVLRMLDKKILPIKAFGQSLWMSAQEDGFIDAPGGKRIYCQDADSPGKVIGLYAQSYSSWVFEQAFTRVHRFLTDSGKKSCVVFSVHDELVIDCHPEELGLMEQLVSLMESDGYVVKKKVGDTYGSVE